MAKKFFLMIVFLTVMVCFATADSDFPKNYIMHCNFASGFSYSLGGKTSSLQDFDIRLVDGYNNAYHFTYFSPTSGLDNVGFNLSLSLPFYYHKYFSVGVSGQVFIKSLIVSTMYYFGGLYVEGIYKKYSLRAGMNLARGYISERFSPVVAAWSGDPGFYNGSKWLNTGDYPLAKSDEYLGLSWNVVLKYYPFKIDKIQNWVSAIHFQLGYSYIPGVTISNYDIDLAGKIYDVPNKPAFKVDPVHNISFLIGFGL